MWEDNRRKKIIMNIVLALLILALIAGLGFAMLSVRRQTQAHDEQLSEIYVQQQQEQSAARQESVDAIQTEYDKDMQTVADYLPGIVCWGDSITQGSAGNISYPAVLKTYLDTYFCDIYDFRSSIENAEDFSRLKWDDYRVNVPVVNMGGGPEDSYTVLGRCGAIPYVLGQDLAVPADTEPVEIKLLSESGKAVSPLTGGNVGVNGVRIGDVEGTLSIDSSAYAYAGYRYYFTRSTPGEEMLIPSGTVVETAATDQFKDYIHIVCIGTYGNYTGADDLVQQTKALLARQTLNSDRFLVIGLCSANGYTSSTYALDAIDTAMLQAFGNRYVNVRKYLCEDGMADAGLTPTNIDKICIAANRVPVSFTTSTNSVELNGKAYQLIGKLVYDRMESLGYFDEVFEELGIKDTTRQILKDDPDYFTRILSNTLK
ncbi:MAG: hypothetical protein IJV41_01000 [Oscillospiraceae bacterium]|nr:hypothetical protein [Oscillospiraceae bacterium]